MENCSRHFADGYLEEFTSKQERNLFICENKSQMIAKTNISNGLVKNYTTILDDIERIDEKFMFNKVFLVGDIFFEIDQESLEELKAKCCEIYTFESEFFNQENIIKTFLKN